MGSLEVNSLDWMQFANCIGADPNLFYQAKGRTPREAKRLCDGCAVKSECLDYAIANDERFGVWGGASAEEREAIRRRL